MLISALLMYFDHQQRGLGSLRTSLSLVVTPIQYAVDFPFRVINLIQSNLSSHQILLAENTALKAQQLLLRGQLQKLIALESENANLRALLTSLPQGSQKIDRVEAGRLLAVNEGSYSREVIVDKGIRMGVYVGQPVLDANGIMGQVIGVGQLTSRILLITDSRSAVPVENSRNGIRAIIVGQGATRQLALINVAETSEMKVGDLLVTSGLGGNYPAGYPVAVISDVKSSKTVLFSHITAKPSAHLDRNTQVLLIWPTQKDVFIDVPIEATTHKSPAHKRITEDVR
jgi:rod shape-determining protein MreC